MSVSIAESVVDFSLKRQSALAVSTVCELVIQYRESACSVDYSGTNEDRENKNGYYCDCIAYTKDDLHAKERLFLVPAEKKGYACR